MTRFEWADWESQRALNDAIDQGQPAAEIAALCHAAIARAAAAARESERIYLTGRLADLLVAQGRFDAALEAYDQVWPGSITPAFYGLQYVAFRLQLGHQSRASQILAQMQERLREETAIPGRESLPYSDQLAVLLAEGQVLIAEARHDIKGKERKRLNQICTRIVGLAQHMPFLPYVDTGFLRALVVAHEYDMARQILDFIATVRPRTR